VRNLFLQEKTLVLSLQYFAVASGGLSKVTDNLGVVLTSASPFRRRAAERYWLPSYSTSKKSATDRFGFVNSDGPGFLWDRSDWWPKSGACPSCTSTNHTKKIQKGGWRALSLRRFKVLHFELYRSQNALNQDVFCAIRSDIKHWIFRDIQYTVVYILKLNGLGRVGWLAAWPQTPAGSVDPSGMLRGRTLISLFVVRRKKRALTFFEGPTRCPGHSACCNTGTFVPVLGAKVVKKPTVWIEDHTRSQIWDSPVILFIQYYTIW